MEDNTPYGFDDEGVIVKSGGTARNKKHEDERKWLFQMNKNWPSSIEQAEAEMNVIRQNPKSYNFEQGE